MEKDAWAGRAEIGDVPMVVVTVDYGETADNEAARLNVEDQKGWLVLSPQAKQIVVDTGHVIHHEDPALVIDVVREVVEAAR